MENGALHLAHKDRVITMGHLADEVALDTAQGVIEDRQPQFARAEGCGIKTATNAFLRLEKDGGQILLIRRQDVQ